jgi:hypothetical protein
MKTSAALIAEIRDILFEVEDHHLAVLQYARLLITLTACPDLEGTAEGMNRRAIEAAHVRMSTISKDLETLSGTPPMATTPAFEMTEAGR